MVVWQDLHALMQIGVMGFKVNKAVELLFSCHVKYPFHCYIVVYHSILYYTIKILKISKRIHPQQLYANRLIITDFTGKMPNFSGSSFSPCKGYDRKPIISRVWTAGQTERAFFLDGSVENIQNTIWIVEKTRL